VVCVGVVQVDTIDLGNKGVVRGKVAAPVFQEDETEVDGEGLSGIVAAWQHHSMEELPR